MPITFAMNIMTSYPVDQNLELSMKMSNISKIDPESGLWLHKTCLLDTQL